MGKTYTYRGISKATPFSADDKRRVSMRLRGLTLALGHGAKVSETVAPVEPSKPKLTVVYETDEQPKLTERQKLEQENAALRKRIAMKKAAKKAKKASSDEFYDEVIVGKRDERIEKRPYRCPVKDCYKEGQTFTANGWNGDGTNKGHVDIAHDGDSKVTKAAIAARLK